MIIAEADAMTTYFDFGMGEELGAVLLLLVIAVPILAGIGHWISKQIQ